MAPSTQRIELLREDFRRFTRALQRLKGGDFQAVEPAWLATRRLREILPVLQLDSGAVRKASARLRKLSRRLAEARDLDGVLQVVDAMMASERRARSAFARVQADVQKAAGQYRAQLTKKKSVHEARRVADKLDELLQDASLTIDQPSHSRDLRWAVGARVARRAATLKDAIGTAGSVYLAERLQSVRVALTKFRFAMELSTRLGAGASAADTRALIRIHALLGRLYYTQALIDRVREVQSKLATPDLRVWRELDGVVVALESRSRALHARYVRERDAVVALCDRVAAKAPVAGGSAGRRVS